jgi:hypothetical protein
VGVRANDPWISGPEVHAFPSAGTCGARCNNSTREEVTFQPQASISCLSSPSSIAKCFHGCVTRRLSLLQMLETRIKTVHHWSIINIDHLTTVQRPSWISSMLRRDFSSSSSHQPHIAMRMQSIRELNTIHDDLDGKSTIYDMRQCFLYEFICARYTFYSLLLHNDLWSAAQFP